MRVGYQLCRNRPGFVQVHRVPHGHAVEADEARTGVGKEIGESMRLEDLQKIFPSWKEDKYSRPIVDPREVAEFLGMGTDPFDIDTAKRLMIRFAKEKGLKQPIFVERDQA